MTNELNSIPTSPAQADDTPIANMVAGMLDRDASRDEIVTAIQAAERHARHVTDNVMRHVTQNDYKRKAAIRSKRYRDNRRVARHVTASRDATNSLLTNIVELDALKKESTKSNIRVRKSPSVTLPVDWQPTDKHFEAAQKLGYSRQAVLEKAEDMKIWAEAKAICRPGWNATFHGFLRRDAPRPPSSKPKIVWAPRV